MEGYAFPPGFNLDENKDEDGPLQADKTIDNYNLETKIANLVNHVTDVLATQKNKGNVMLLWGDDFSYMNAGAQFKRLE